MLKTRFFALLLALVPVLGFAAGKVHLEDAPIDLQDKASLQRGAGLFMNYCAACHSLQYMRYSRLAEDLDLTPEQVEQFIIKGDAKIGDMMKTGMAKGDGQAWFGKAPPDLSTTARGKIGQEDWIYTFLKSFYVDETRPKGWNNTVLAAPACPTCSGSCRACSARPRRASSSRSTRRAVCRRKSTTARSSTSRPF